MEQRRQKRKELAKKKALQEPFLCLEKDSKTCDKFDKDILSSLVTSSCLRHMYSCPSVFMPLYCAQRRQKWLQHLLDKGSKALVLPMNIHQLLLGQVKIYVHAFSANCQGQTRMHAKVPDILRLGGLQPLAHRAYSFQSSCVS